MDGIHDCGGVQGYGRVEYKETEPVFHEEWEGRVFALLSEIHAKGISSWNKSRRYREEMGNELYITELRKSYYSHWLIVLERLLVDAGIFSESDRQERVRQLMHGASIVDRAGTPAPVGYNQTGLGAPFESEAFRLPGVQPRYSVGDEVVARSMRAHGHTRSPRYIRGHRGRVVASHGCRIYPDGDAAGLGETPEPLYTVRFEAQELWGTDADPRDRVHVDLWEPYISLSCVAMS
jgi:nitrile hydratase beta subunit